MEARFDLEHPHWLQRYAMASMTLLRSVLIAAAIGACGACGELDCNETLSCSSSGPETGGTDVLTHAPGAGPARSVVVWSSPEGGTNALKLLYLFALAAARESIDIQSPYLVTDESARWSLQEARRRGVRIRILTEGDITDAKPVKFASRATYDALMTMGVDVYEYQPAMMHVKAIIVDGVMSIVGSANFDNRSLELNDELNVVLFERGVAARLSADFERDLTRSTRLNLEEWRSRPPHIRAREQAWSLFSELF
jgi:cardiolipin synthase